MKKLSIYCMALKNENLETIKSLNYIPVGLKNNDFSNEWLRDNTKIISHKKTHTMENILFIIGTGKIYYNLKKVMNG